MSELNSITVSRRRFLQAGIAFAIVGGVYPARAAPDAELWPFWQAHDPASAYRVDHGLWHNILAEYRRTDRRGQNIARFDYAAAKRAGVGKSLADYLGSLTGIDPRTLNRAEQLAYWVNLYNALTVRVVLDHYPVKSIRDIDISPGLFSSGPWGKKLVVIAGERVSLDDIEHRILRPIWRDARLHYVLNCASLGCPDLPSVALTSENAPAILDQAAAGFINHPRGARIDAKGRLHVSSIYRWFQSDFGRDDRGVIRHLAGFAGPELAAGLATVGEIYDHDYDWTLNRP